MPTYYFAGLMYINGCHGTADQRVLIPDGSSGDIQPPLDASILVAKDDCVGATLSHRERELDNGSGTATFLEFQLKKRSVVRLPHSGGARCVKLDAGLPRAEDAEFEPNLVDPDTIAEIELGGGTLTARALDGVPIVEWIVDHDPKETVTITATRVDEKGDATTQELTVKGDAAVVFVHSSDLFAEGPKGTSGARYSGDYETGAKLYSKIAVRPVDPELFEAHRKPKQLQADIPDDQQKGVLFGLKHRPEWLNSDPPWCCPPTRP